MPFPDSPRVIYRKNPLAEVICQLKFPPILRIDSELPSGFQDRIRADYPLYTERRQTPAGVPPNVHPEVIKLIQSIGSQASSAHHNFGSGDSSWTVTLTRDFLALKTTAYRRWEEFRERIEQLLPALTEEYNPAFFTRIGLRYSDVIQRSELGLVDVPWSDLLNPHIAGEFSFPNIVDEIEHAARETVLRFDEHGGRVMIRHGIATVDPENEQCFIVDVDLFVEAEQETANAISILNRFNEGAGQIFRWCIHERLHSALGPEAVPD